MSIEEGRVFGIHAAGQATEMRRKIFSSKIETLAKLHDVRSEKIGLGDFRRPGNYFAARSIGDQAVMRVRDEAYSGVVEKLMYGLPDDPAGAEALSPSSRGLRRDNMIFELMARACCGVDWELSTLGDPMAASPIC